MKKFVIIATLSGLACGIGIRKLQVPVEMADENGRRLETSESRRNLNSSESDPLISLAWNLRGNLTSEELLELPYGGRLMAELSLWSTKAEPDELAAHWDRLMESGEKDMNVLDHYAILWARRDPDGAHAHLKGGDEEYRILWAIARIDAEKALALVDPDNRKCLSKIIRAIGQTNPDYAMTLRDQYPHHDSHDSSSGIADGLKDIDPALAVEFAAREEYFDSDHFRWWIAKDPKAAFAWGLKNKGLVSSSLSSLVPMLLEKDPEYFAQQIQGIPTGKLKLEMLKAQANYLAGRDPQEALAFADSQEGPSRVALMHSVGGALVQNQPEQAHLLFKTFLKEDLEQKSYALAGKEWVKRLIEHDPEGVLASAQEMAPSEEGKIGGVEASVFREWMTLDAEASREWIQDQNPGPERDRYLDAYIQTKQYGNNADYGQLMDLTGELSDEATRNLSSSRIIQRWQDRSPDELRSYMESPNASAVDLEYYRKNILGE